MERKKLSIIKIVSIILLSAIALGALVIVIDNIRWDKVPVIGLFVLGISKSMGVAASYYDHPLTCEEFINKPEDWPEKLGYWFSNSLNNYTQGLIYDYMKENNLGIVPKDYVFETTSDFEKMLEILEFVPLD